MSYPARAEGLVNRIMIVKLKIGLYTKKLQVYKKTDNVSLYQLSVFVDRERRSLKIEIIKILLLYSGQRS